MATPYAGSRRTCAKASGPLAAEALAHLMEAEERLGRHDEAVATARKYLGAYPKGAHRDVAERLAAH